MEPRLNYFIAGAPKCGTTSLFYYLTQHPNVYDPGYKEVNYFCEDFPTLRNKKDLASYQQLFSRVSATDLAIGEASVAYLYSATAPRLIHEMNPDARIILMVRDPTDLVYSLHMQLLSTLNEVETDFEKAWALQDERAQGRLIPQKCTEPFFLQYREIGRLGKYLQRMLDVFPADQVKVIFYDDFKTQTLVEYESVLKFLELPPFPDVELQVLNVSHANRSELLAHLIDRVAKSGPGRQLGELKKRLPMGKVDLYESLRNLNRKKSPRKPLSPQFKVSLRQEFAEDVRLLAQLTGRNLDQWSA